MIRRTILAAAALGLVVKPSGAQNLLQSAKDAVLSLNPNIIPKNNEKLLKLPAPSSYGRWDQTTCASRVPPLSERFTKHKVFIRECASPESIPLVEVPLVRFEFPQTKRVGFYLYVSHLISFLKLPSEKPNELIATTSEYFDCNDSRSIQSTKVAANSCSFDYRRISLVVNGKVHHPTHYIHNTYEGLTLRTDIPATLEPLEGPTRFPKKTYSPRQFGLVDVIFFDLPIIPIRFNLELPPLNVLGVEVPMPEYVFEPFDLLSNQFVG